MGHSPGGAPVLADRGPGRMLGIAPARSTPPGRSRPTGWTRAPPSRSRGLWRSRRASALTGTAVRPRDDRRPRGSLMRTRLPATGRGRRHDDVRRPPDPDRASPSSSRTHRPRPVKGLAPAVPPEYLKPKLARGFLGLAASLSVYLGAIVGVAVTRSWYLLVAAGCLRGTGRVGPALHRTRLRARLVLANPPLELRRSGTCRFCI